MTGMLASVRDRREAEIVLRAGVDIIDLKEPARGALGAVETAVIEEVVAFVAGRRPVSAACGDLPMLPQVIRAKVAEVAATGVDYIKIGVLPSAALPACAQALRDLAGRHRLIAVLFADHRYEDDVLAPFAAAGFHGGMVDTADKSKGRLLAHWPQDRIAAFVGDCQARGLVAGLAGSLEVPDIPRLLLHRPDFLGFRGALCDGQARNAAIDSEAVVRIRALMADQPRPAAPERADGRQPVAGRYRPDAVLPVEIGADGVLHGQAQTVGVDATADMLRVIRGPQDRAVS